MFSWSKTNKPGKSNGYTRQQHIVSYLTDPTLKPSTRKINDTTYDTVFQTRDQNALILRVHMASSLAIAAPKMTLVGVRAVHPWIDSKMRVVGYPRIQSDKAFVSSGILLAQAVNDVVKQLQLNPPSQLVIVDAGLKTLQDSIRVTAGNGHAQSNGAGHQQANGNQPPSYGSQFRQSALQQHKKSLYQLQQDEPPEYQLPPHFRSIIKLTDQEIRQQTATLQNLELPTPPSTIQSHSDLDRSKMTLMIDDPVTHLVPTLLTLPVVQEISALQHTMVESNSNLAQHNLEKQPELEEIHSEVKELQGSLKEKMEEVNDLQRKMMELCKPMESKKILHKLKKAKKEALEESEELAMEWLEGDTGANVNDFLDRFLEVRTVLHVRAAKMERLERA
jgi:hypothetical protein